MSSHSKRRKANDEMLILEGLDRRARALMDADYPVSKWITFAQRLIRMGYNVRLYEARQTVSKYLTVRHNTLPMSSFKVRFSNHKPIKQRELAGDCDFFVGYTHLHRTTTDDAWKATMAHFAAEHCA